LRILLIKRVGQSNIIYLLNWLYGSGRDTRLFDRIISELKGLIYLIN